jgi:NitT/TauT family transport system substrate-binding protein
VSRRPRLLPAALLALLLVLSAAACGGDGGGGSAAGGGGGEGGEDTLSLGYFPNVTHATALVGVHEGIFQDALGGTTLETATFNAGPEAVEALLSGAIDATFIGPNPAVNAYAQSGGKAVRIVSGATSGGAFLVVNPEIDGPKDLAGRSIASPQLGNTQDVALRAWLADNGLATTPEGGGDVEVVPQSNSDTLDQFTTGDIDGAWVPEPWATRMVQEGGGKVLVDERDLWASTGGEYVTTHLIVRTDYLEANRDTVRSLLEGVVEANTFVAEHPDEAQSAVADEILAITDQEIAPEVLAASWANLTFTVDPVAASLQQSADDAVALGLLDEVDLRDPGIYDLSLLNEVLGEDGGEAVSGL